MKSIANKTSLVFDLFFCFVFMPILLVLGPAHYWFSQWTLFAIIVGGYQYVCYFVLSRLNLPKLLLARDYWKIAGVMVLLIGINYLLSLYPLPELDFVIPSLSEYQTRIRNFSVSIILWLMFSLVVGYSLTSAFVKELYEQLLLKKQIEAQRDKAELAMFKAQISPHFLFNTLNSLYSLVIGTSEKAEDAFIKFTEILKYTYVTIEKDTVTIAEEIAYIQNYIDLQLIRLNECAEVIWEHETDDSSVLLPPMLMLTFVENAFKYGASTSNRCTIRITLRLKEGVLDFTTENRIMRHSDEFRKDMPVGLENCRARLETLYPQRYTLAAAEKDGKFNVTLNIHLLQ